MWTTASGTAVLRLIVAQSGFLSDVAALIAAITGFIGILFVIWKYLDERKRRLQAEAREKQLEAALNDLQQSMDQLLEPLPETGVDMDPKVVAHVQQLADVVTQLRRDVNDLKNRVIALEKGNGERPPPPPPEDLERRLRADANIQRLLNNANWRGAADAAIRYFVRGEECPVAGWRTSSTWQQVQAVYDRLGAATR